MRKPQIAVQNTEGVAGPKRDRRQRRQFSSEEKLRILNDADRCKARGEVTALLRREAIYSSHLTEWRKQLRAHGEAGLAAKAPGRKPRRDERDRQLEKLERDKAKLEHELLVARKLLELAGKAHKALSVARPSHDNGRRALMDLLRSREPTVPFRAACEVLGIPRATARRHIAPPMPRPLQCRSRSPFKLAADEEQVLKEALRADRFSDQAPSTKHPSRAACGESGDERRNWA